MPNRSRSRPAPKRPASSRDPAVTSKIMAAVRGRDTRPELALRAALHRRGLRYRVHPGNVPGKPDLVNRSRRIAVFVDGDFWHGNPREWQRRGFDSMEDQFAGDNRERWIAKLRRNVERDREVNQRLAAEGWRVLRFWESELKEDLGGVVERIARAWSVPA